MIRRPLLTLSAAVRAMAKAADVLEAGALFFTTTQRRGPDD